MRKHRLTLVGLTIAVAVLIFAIIFDFEVFEAAIGFLDYLEHFEIDEFIIPALVFFGFAFVDQSRQRKSQKIEYEKIKIYKAMLSSTHHILNNFLNQMLIFQMTAKKAPDFDPKVLSLYDRIVEDASTQIEALGSITRIDEVSIHESVEP